MLVFETFVTVAATPPMVTETSETEVGKFYPVMTSSEPPKL